MRDMRGAAAIATSVLFLTSVSGADAQTNGDRLRATEIGCLTCVVVTGDMQRAYNWCWRNQPCRQPGNAAVVFGAQAGFDLLMKDGQAWWASVALFGAIEALAVADHALDCGGYCCSEPLGGPWQCMVDYGSRAIGSVVGRKLLGGPGR